MTRASLISRLESISGSNMRVRSAEDRETIKEAIRALSAPAVTREEDSLSRDHAPAICATPPGFTPGPWMAPHFADDSHPCNCAYILAAPYMGSIAVVNRAEDQPPERAKGYPAGDEAKANTLLLGAAPDLYEAAQMLASLEHEDGGRSFPTKEQCAFARAALAKATGNIAPADGARRDPTSTTDGDAVPGTNP